MATMNAASSITNTARAIAREGAETNLDVFFAVLGFEKGTFAGELCYRGTVGPCRFAVIFERGTSHIIGNDASGQWFADGVSFRTVCEYIDGAAEAA